MRKRYIINWKFQLRYIVFMIFPMVFLGLFAVTIGFRVSFEMVNTQRQQLMVMISSLEESLKELQVYSVNKIAVDKAVNTIRGLKNFSQDLISINSLQLKRVTNMVAFAMFVVIAGAVLLGIFFSHRIAGPIFRLKRCIRELGTNVLSTPIRVRHTDEFQDLASCLENLRQSLIDSTNKRRDLVAKANQKLLGLEEKASKGIMPLTEEIEAVKSEISELNKVC